MPDFEERGGFRFELPPSRATDKATPAQLGGPEDEGLAALVRRLHAGKEGKQLDAAAEINAPQTLTPEDHSFWSALRAGQDYWHSAEGRPIFIGDILENHRRLRRALEALDADGLWPCILTRHPIRFSAPLDVPPALATLIVAQLSPSPAGDQPFPSGQAEPVQQAVGKADGWGDLSRRQPFFFGATQTLIGLPAENAEAGFVRGAKLDGDVRAPFSPPEPLDPDKDPPQARVTVEAARSNLTVIRTNGYFPSTLMQFGVSNPACNNLAYGLYRFGIEVNGYPWYQESLVSIPDQLRVSLDLVPKD